MDKVIGSGVGVLRSKAFNISVDTGGPFPIKLPELPSKTAGEVEDNQRLQSVPVPVQVEPTTSKGMVRMARRNARERNRVRQVNQGFLTLRHHLPEPFRVSRMSKVDTLRSALNYIVSLEKVLIEGIPMDDEDQSSLEGNVKQELFNYANESKENH